MVIKFGGFAPNNVLLADLNLTVERHTAKLLNFPAQRYLKYSLHAQVITTVFHMIVRITEKIPD